MSAVEIAWTSESPAYTDDDDGYWDDDNMPCGCCYCCGCDCG